MALRTRKLVDGVVFPAALFLAYGILSTMIKLAKIVGKHEDD